MSNNRVGRVVQQLHHVAALSDAQTSDGQLLAAFIAQRDETAFAALVRRYGPMVLGVCRRVLRNTSDADDAFQATFLVLVRRAAQVRCRASLGNWLYGVAYRTALHARTTNARRRRIEGQARPVDQQASAEDAAMQSELQRLLDQELNALPAKYRELIVLCDLLGKTKHEAAEQLRCPEGTVSSRLARGRELLRKRLARHGTALSLAALAALLEQNKAPAAAPLIDTTVKTAVLVAAGNVAAAGALTPNAATLMEGVLKSMLLTKLKIATVLIFALAVLGATTTLVACRSLADAPPAPPNLSAKNVPVENVVNAKDEEKPRADRERFRYAGKDFAYWRDVLHNDLQPEMLNEALKALSAFAEHGYTDEAIATILEEMRDPERGDPNTGIGFGTAPATLAKIGPKALPALSKEWDRGKTKERRFVAETLAQMTIFPETVPLLIRVVKDKDKVVRRSAIDGLAKIQPKTKEIEAALHGVLEDEEELSNISVALEALVGETAAPYVSYVSSSWDADDGASSWDDDDAV